MYPQYYAQDGYRNIEGGNNDDRFPFLPFLAGLAVSPLIFGGPYYGAYYGRPPYPYYGRPPYYGFPPYYGGYPYYR